MKKLIGNSVFLITLIFTVLFLAFLSGCNSPIDPVTYNEYFPLAVGNKWYYNKYYFPDSTGINLLTEITGPKVIDGKTYFKTVSVYLTEGISDTTYYRINGTTLFMRKPGVQERVYADFSLSLDDTAYWDRNFKVLAKDKNVITFGTASGSNVGLFVTFKKGVGIIKLVDNGFIYHRITLVKAEIK